MSIPTMNKMVKVYVEAASIERLKCGRPTEGTVRNTIAGVRTFHRWLNERREQLGYETIGYGEDFPLVSIVKPMLIHKYLADMLKRGTKAVTALSYINQLQQLFARWTRPYYEDRGWKIPPFPSLGGRPKSPRYNRPSREKLLRLKNWYECLGNRERMFQARRRNVPARELWFVTTMMLEFAMRNSDIKRLTPDNFIEHDGRIYLNYTPHKTERSSGRIVKWPIHPAILSQWRSLQHTTVNPDSPIPDLPSLDAETFDALNREMRTLGFTGSKGAYELRKICIDHIYQKYGAEMATSISGDDIKTIIHYYADPSQPNIGEVRVTDLF